MTATQTRKGIWYALTLTTLSALTAASQEALRESLAGERAAEARQRALQTQAYNLHVGPVNFRFGASSSVELNDNIYISDQSRKEDAILRPGLSLQAHWPVTEKNALNLAVGLSYAKYLTHDEYDRFLISPGSQVSFDLFVRDVRLTFYDRFAYTQDPLEVGALSGVANYGGLQNTAGLDALWDLNQAILWTSYGHFNFVSASSDFEYLNRATELFFGRLGFLPNETTIVGLETSGSLNAYDRSHLSDSTGFSAGGFVDWRMSEYVRVQPRAGYVAYRFESAFGAKPADVSTYYLSLGVEHRLSEHVTHALEGGREITLGFNARFYDVYFARHRITWDVIENVGLGTQVFYERGEEPSFAYQVPGFPVVLIFPGEQFDRWGLGVSLSYRLMEKLTGTLAYRFTRKASDVAYRDYTQNAVTLGLIYQF